MLAPNLMTTPPFETALKPTSPKRRSATLDSLRGFALLGVLVVNVYQSYTVVQTATDERVALAIRLLGEGTFYPIFSFLFGLGFSLQLSKGEAAVGLFRRRLRFLLLFGLGHGYFIWQGDILAIYALVGFLLSLFYKKSDGVLLTTALLGWGLTALLLSPVAGDALSFDLPERARYAEGTYWAVTRLRAGAFSGELIGGVLVFGGFLLALFLLGLLVGRRGLNTVLSSRPWLSSVFLLSLTVSLPLLVLFQRAYERGEAGSWFLLEYLLASPFLGFAYLSGLSLFMLTPLGKAAMKPFSYVGRTALSNYLGQSVICTLIFYGYGLGYYGEFGARDTLLISLAVFAFQLWASYLWLRRFRYGPAEWLWRSLTYREWQPLRYEEGTRHAKLNRNE